MSACSPIDISLSNPLYFICLGLGVCVLAEFARFLIYGLLVDGEQNEDVDSSDDEADVAMQENDFFRGYKQMILILQSETVETGKSFLSEMLARMFHGSKHGISSTISFDSARKLLGKGEPVIIGKLQAH